MLPVYFLSVLLNVLLGFLLAFGKEDAGGDGFSLNLDNETLRFVLGGVSFITGILKILSPVTGNVPVAGDVVPALANLAGGFIFVFDFYRKRSTLDSPAAARLGELADKHRKLAGYVCLGAGALHWIFYPVLFL
ncbi:MAG: hypothetical protein LBD31_09745 [Treponema sp.]|jgi:hypothetical protein|nr:hypothetical protein [Treponema sp.]